MRKVFFITGTGRSGSTLLDLMIGNDANGFSAGELVALMRPWKHEHILESGCICGRSGCDFWQGIKSEGEKNIYKNIFKKTGANYIVDSSKDVLWMKDQIEYSSKWNYKIIPILIFKYPLEYLYSKFKRNSYRNWKREWATKHRRIFKVLDDFVTIKYRELAVNPSQKLDKLCDKVGLNYFKGKEKFWENNSHHLLFGSGTVKKSDQLIYYKDQFESEKLEYLKENFSFKGQRIEDILKVLEAYEVNNTDVSESDQKLREELGKYSIPYRVFHRLQSTPYLPVNGLFNNLRKIKI